MKKKFKKVTLHQSLSRKEELAGNLGLKFDEVAELFSEETLENLYLTQIVGGNNGTQHGCNNVAGCGCNNVAGCGCDQSSGCGSGSQTTSGCGGGSHTTSGCGGSSYTTSGCGSIQDKPHCSCILV